VRRFAGSGYASIISYRYERGRHIAPQDAPDLLLDDIRGFFRRLR
jgi:epoxide hydrolase